jgi:hypothetical protein
VNAPLQQNAKHILILVFLDDFVPIVFYRLLDSFYERNGFRFLDYLIRFSSITHSQSITHDSDPTRTWGSFRDSRQMINPVPVLATGLFQARDGFDICLERVEQVSKSLLIRLLA